MLDADVPDGCRISVAARATDDALLIESLPFIDQPVPYLRGHGSELPWHDPWHNVTRPGGLGTGTWELLFQAITGRYVQLHVTLHGTGRTSPSLRALRAWYPRFSYVANYLPEVYQLEDEPHRFLERLLANMEGLLTDAEVGIEWAWMLADPRLAPAGALDWLASWVGLSLEPAWSEDKRRFMLVHTGRVYRARGTIAGLRSLLRLYLGCRPTEERIFAAGPLADDPARVVDLVGPHRFRVTIPQRLGDDEAAMVRLIVEAARPAHASFEIRSYRNLLVIGEAQLGIDSIVAASPRLVPMRVGETVVATGTVAASHPFDVEDRVVSDRDRLGEYPPL